MKISLIINGALVLLLAMTNQGRLAALSEWIYSLLCSSFTIPAILALYGLVLIYLLVSVYHLENTTDHSSTRRHRNRLVPYYNSKGQLQGWVREEKSQKPEATRTSHPQHKQTSSLPVPTPITAPAERNAASAPAKSTTPLPLPPASASAPAPLSLEYWDGFPDGRLRCHFTPQQLEDTSQLAIYWVGDRLSGKQGSPTTATPEKGKVSHFQCAGVVECESKVCVTQIAPGANISRQVQSECTCGLKLRHRLCKFEWSIILYRGGAVLESNYTHSHSRYTHSLSTPKSKPPHLQSFISRQPVSLISPQPSKPLNAESAESPANSVGQVDEGQQTRQHTPEPEPKPELAPQNQVTDLDHEPRRKPSPQNGVLNSDDERIMDPDAT
ncbi:hypothetical protein R3P38DRAFT_3241751 [Favolaschia claudopus]|uniref:Uncharacterized protein n=1 Tax=Favolaschia claudopus TaxID=2862362 RepID=A0AAV9Z624_9AGAR